MVDICVSVWWKILKLCIKKGEWQVVRMDVHYSIWYMQTDFPNNPMKTSDSMQKISSTPDSESTMRCLLVTAGVGVSSSESFITFLFFTSLEECDEGPDFLLPPTAVKYRRMSWKTQSQILVSYHIQKSCYNFVSPLLLPDTYPRSEEVNTSPPLSPDIYPRGMRGQHFTSKHFHK